MLKGITVAHVEFADDLTLMGRWRLTIQKLMDNIMMNSKKQELTVAHAKCDFIVFDLMGTRKSEKWKSLLGERS